MTPSQVYEALDDILHAGLATFIHGAPGIGKSTIVADYARDHDLEIRDIRASQLDPVDARGVPIPDKENRVTSWFPPDFLPSDPDSRGILFLDELNKANQDTQSALYQLILEGRIGDYVLPKGWHIVSAGNREEDASMVQPMARALKNRFIHLEMEADYDDWHHYAVTHNFNERVIAFMKFRPTSLDEFGQAIKDNKGKKIDTLRNSNAFATPRSWEFVSRLLDKALARGRTMKDCYSLIEGTIGPHMAGEFIAYCDIYLELPDLDELLKKPGKYKMPDDPGQLYALGTGLSARANMDNFANVKTLMDRMPPEYAMWAMDDCLKRNEEIGKHPAYLKWVYKNIDFAS